MKKFFERVRKLFDPAWTDRVWGDEIASRDLEWSTSLVKVRGRWVVVQSWRRR